MTRQKHEDIAAVVDFKGKFAAGEEEFVPAGLVNRVLDGDNKVRVWREQCNLSKRDLASQGRD